MQMNLKADFICILGPRIKYFYISLKKTCHQGKLRGFYLLLILTLDGMQFHAVVVLGYDILFKSILGHCGM